MVSASLRALMDGEEEHLFKASRAWRMEEEEEELPGVKRQLDKPSPAELKYFRLNSTVVKSFMTNTVFYLLLSLLLLPAEFHSHAHTLPAHVFFTQLSAFVMCLSYFHSCCFRYDPNLNRIQLLAENEFRPQPSYRLFVCY